MRTFTASMSFELSADTPPQARQLLIAELVGRRWQERIGERRLPRYTLLLRRSLGDDETTDDLHRRCAVDLRNAARAVVAAGLPLRVRRAFIQVSGAGTYGLTDEGFFDEPA